MQRPSPRKPRPPKGDRPDSAPGSAGAAKAARRPSRLTLDDPGPFLRWLGSGSATSIKLDDLEVAEIWGLVALATLGRKAPGALRIHRGAGNTSRFAHAVGLFDLMRAQPPASEGEAGRTVTLRRIARPEEIEPAARALSHLLVQDRSLEDTRRVLYYVLVELMRNAVQHSHDPLGGVVAAQLNRGGRNAARPMIQVAVADAGIGIPESLQGHHPQLTEPEAALDKALWPHISGTFEEGLTGNEQNAGMGLFFIAEMTKLTAGHLAIASRGATLLLTGDPEAQEHHQLRFVPPPGTGFPGTLVAFELPVGEVRDFDALIETIRGSARQRTPQRAVHRWIRFARPPAGTRLVVVRLAAEDTTAAMRCARETLLPRLVRREAVALDFRDLPVCTQSYVHALLFEPLRVAWALRAEIYVENAQPAVRSSLELLENYALGG